MAVPNSLVAGDVQDLVALTLKNLGHGSYTDLTSDLQEHTAINELLKVNRYEVHDGYALQWQVAVNFTQNARNVGLFAQDATEVGDGMVNASADWKYTTNSYAIEQHMVTFNRGESRIVDYIKWQRDQSLIGMAELMESNFWGPPVALTDVTTPWGINTWIVKNATEGFNGGAPSGYTVIGINPTTYPRWKNYTGNYVTMGQDDGIAMWRRAADKTNFKPTVPGLSSYSTGNKYGYYHNYTTKQVLENTLLGQNENLGNDIASKDGKAMFRGVPCQWVPFLDRDTTNPVYGVNWGNFKTYILNGWWMRPTYIKNKPGQHLIDESYTDCAYNWICRNRRENFVIATAATYPS